MGDRRDLGDQIVSSGQEMVNGAAGGVIGSYVGQGSGLLAGALSQGIGMLTGQDNVRMRGNHSLQFEGLGDQRVRVNTGFDSRRPEQGHLTNLFGGGRAQPGTANISQQGLKVLTAVEALYNSDTQPDYAAAQQQAMRDMQAAGGVVTVPPGNLVEMKSRYGVVQISLPPGNYTPDQLLRVGALEYGRAVNEEVLANKIVDGMAYHASAVAPQYAPQQPHPATGPYAGGQGPVYTQPRNIDTPPGTTPGVAAPHPAAPTTAPQSATVDTAAYSQKLQQYSAGVKDAIGKLQPGVAHEKVMETLGIRNGESLGNLELLLRNSDNAARAQFRQDMAAALDSVGERTGTDVTAAKQQLEALVQQSQQAGPTTTRPTAVTSRELEQYYNDLGTLNFGDEGLQKKYETVLQQSRAAQAGGLGGFIAQFVNMFSNIISGTPELNGITPEKFLAQHEDKLDAASKEKLPQVLASKPQRDTTGLAGGSPATSQPHPATVAPTAANMGFQTGDTLAGGAGQDTLRDTQAMPSQLFNHKAVADKNAPVASRDMANGGHRAELNSPYDFAELVSKSDLAGLKNATGGVEATEAQAATAGAKPQQVYGPQI